MSGEIIADLKRVECINLEGKNCFDITAADDGSVNVFSIDRKTAAVLDIGGTEVVIWSETLKQAVSETGDALFIYEPASAENKGFIDAYNPEEDFEDVFFSKDTFVIRLPKEKVIKAQRDIDTMNSVHAPKTPVNKEKFFNFSLS